MHGRKINNWHSNQFSWLLFAISIEADAAHNLEYALAKNVALRRPESIGDLYQVKEMMFIVNELEIRTTNIATGTGKSKAKFANKF